MDNRAATTIHSLALCLYAAAGWSYANAATVNPKISGPVRGTVEAAAPVAARSAFYEMYKPARQWAKDVMPLMVSSGEAPGVRNEAGTAGMWTAVFVSASRREARTFYYAVTDSGGEIRKGVTIGRVQEWGGPTVKSKPFLAGEFAVDSDAAYATAAKQAGTWLRKNPARKLAIYLVSESRFAGPTWYFMWGDKKSGYLTFVSAITGQLLTGK